MSWPSAASGARTHASASASSSSSSAAVFTLPSMLPAHAHGTPIRMPKRHHHLANAERAFEVPPQAHQSLVPPTTSRYFSGPTTRVCAPNLHQPPHQWQQQQRQPIVVGPPAQVQLAPSTGAPALHLKTLFFASQRGGHLRALLRHADPETPSTSGATPTSAASSLFRLPQLGLYELFTVKAASNLLPDLLVSGPKSVAFLLATEKELAKEANRDELVQRCAQVRQQYKHLYVLYLKDGDKSDRMTELRSSHRDLPPVLTCSTYEFMVQCIGIVTRVIGSEPIEQAPAHAYPPHGRFAAPAAAAQATCAKQQYQPTTTPSYAMVE